MNRNVRFKTGIGPLLDPMEKPSDLRRRACCVIYCSKLQPVGKAISLTRTALPDKTALIGFAGAPWTLITYMAEGGSSRDFAKARLWAWQDKDRFRWVTRDIDRCDRGIFDHTIQGGCRGINAV